MPVAFTQAHKINLKREMTNLLDDSGSLVNIFQSLQINGNEYENCKPRVPSAGTHDNFTCRMPQTAGDGDNCDDMKLDTDTDTDSSSDIICVVDSSDAPSVVSFIHPHLLNTTSESDTSNIDPESHISIPETETETESVGESDGSRSKSGGSMDIRIRTPAKRKYASKSNNKNLGSVNDSESSSLVDVESTEVQSRSVSRVITTRSGRAVRAPIDDTFDYSSEQHDDDDDSDYQNSETNKVDNDHGVMDNSDCEDRSFLAPTCKQRRLQPIRNSCSSSSDVSSTVESFGLIYLDLTQPVAIVHKEPTPDVNVEGDSELKTRLEKFLGLVARQRRLYNPNESFDMPENLLDFNTPPTVTSRHTAQSITTSTPSKMRTQGGNIQLLMENFGSKVVSYSMKRLLINEMVQRSNADCFESQTPDHIKEPIDLSGLPSQRQRAHNCHQHKRIANLLGPYPGVYSFIDSLKSDTPLNMCHPLSITYRKREFDSCKVLLAKTVFHVLNHLIFHCGLRASIRWKRLMNMPSASFHYIESSGQRMSRIVLDQQLKHAGILVKSLLHEMCHAAAFVYHGETGHGDNCRKWAYRAKSELPELPQIDDCKARFKYTCMLCHRCSFGVIQFEAEAEHLRCHYCQFQVNVEAYNEDSVHNLSLTDQLVTPFKEFVRANYTKCPGTMHSAKMKLLNAQYKEQLHHPTASI